MTLVNIVNINKKIKLDLRYATRNNFTNKKLYPKSICLLEKEVALALNKIQIELEKQNLGLIIWDGYRPPSVQEKLREYFDDENFVDLVSNHSKGISVDVSLCDKRGVELKMPTDFDDFSKKANSAYPNLSRERIENRSLLKEIMEKHDFKQDENEWWHFDFEPLINSG